MAGGKKAIKKRKKGDISPDHDSSQSQAAITARCSGCNLDVDGDEYRPLQCSICESSFHDECLPFDADTAEVLRGIVRFVGWVCAPCITRSRDIKSKNMPDSTNTTSSAIKSLEAEIIGFKAACTVIVDEVISVKDTLNAFLGNKKPPNRSLNARGSQDSKPVVRNSIVPIGPEILDPPVTSITMLKTVHTEIHEKERRRHNVIVSGMKRDGSSQITDDIANFIRICSRYLDTDVGEYIVPGRCRRLGNLMPGKIQPLLIAFKTINVPEKLLEVARNLRFVDEEYIAQHVFIGADLTPAEAELAFERRQQRRAKIALRQQPVRVINDQPIVQASTSQSSSSQPSTSIDPAHNNHSSDIQADVLFRAISRESSVDKF